VKIKLTPAFARTAAPPAEGDRVIYWDTELRGFGLLVTKRGHRSYVVQYRTAGRLRRMHLKGATSLRAAKDQGRSILGDVAKGRALRQPIDPLTERRKTEAEARGIGTLKTIAMEWYEREGSRKRSGPQRLAVLKRLVFPTMGSRLIYDIKRSDVVKLLDRIEDTSGPSMADYVLATTRRVMTWHASRDDDYLCPIVRGMARTSPRERARQRVLNDDEIRAVWQAAEGPYGALVRFLLLTAARRGEVAGMRRSELNGDVWTIPEGRYKTGRELVLPLSAQAQAVVSGLPTFSRGDYVFTVDGAKPAGSFTVRKRKLDRASGIANWRIHDLRRTARSLLSRAGVDANIAERCLGHVIGGVRGTYDRYAYYDEKKHAFEALAALVRRILNPPGASVVPIPIRTVGT
jgi:integrase